MGFSFKTFKDHDQKFQKLSQNKICAFFKASLKQLHLLHSKRVFFFFVGFDPKSKELNN
jgi:hypothetical protein